MKKRNLPLEEAITQAAEQNFDRDVRVGLIKRNEWFNPDVIEEYREEAKYLLEETGENYYPDYPDHEHIVVSP